MANSPPKDGKAGALGAEEEEIIRKRLLTQATTSKGDPPFKRLAHLFVKFSNEAEGGTEDVAEDLFRGLQKELAALVVQAAKLQGIQSANTRDQQGYRAKKEQEEAAIIQAQKDIEQRKQELEHARIVRQQNEEYEKMKHQVMQYPQRSVTAAECQQLEADILGLQAESVKLDLAAERKRKQFALLLHCIDQLQWGIDEDEESRGGEEGTGELYATVDIPRGEDGMQID